MRSSIPTDASALFQPMVTQADLESVELRVLRSQIGVGDVRPAAAYLRPLSTFCEYPDSTAAPHSEVEVRSISCRKVCIGTHRTAAQLNIGRDAPGAQARVP